MSTMSANLGADGNGLEFPAEQLPSAISLGLARTTRNAAAWR